MKPSEKLSAFMNGAGFYIVLFLAIAIIGASGYFVYDTVFSERHHTTPPAQTALTDHANAQSANNQTQEATSLPPSADEKITVPVSGTVQIPSKPKEERSTPAEILPPLSGEPTTPFSMDSLLYSETMGDWRTHDGIDICAQDGAAVVSSSAGSVTSIINDYWMGTTVTVNCGNGYELVYASLQSAPPVSVGDRISAGDVIGHVGSSALAEEALGPHLHFSVIKNAVPMDPSIYLSLKK